MQYAISVTAVLLEGVVKPRRRRLSLREQFQQSHAGQSFYAKMAGKPPPPLPELLTMPKRQVSAPGSDGRPLERDVLKAVIAALRADPRVASVERNQSGVFQDGNRYIRVGSKGKLDLTIYLKSGKYIEAEVKREPNVKLLSEAQSQRIKDIRAAGGMAGWCWNVDSAIALLP